MNSNSRPDVSVSGPTRSRGDKLRVRPRLERLEGREVPSITLSSTAPWVSEGPTSVTGGQVNGITTNSVIGAIDAVYASRSTPDLMFAGGPNGGVWRTTNGTAATPTWTPISDGLASLSVTDISIDPSNNSRVLVGIGGSADGGYRGQTYRDANGDVRPVPQGIRGDLIGPLFTTNALAATPTWRVLSGLANRDIGKVYVRSNLLLVGTDVGVYKSTDDGATFTLVRPGFVFDLAEDPGNPNRFYTATKTGGVNNGPAVWRSDDGGSSWGDVSDTTQFPNQFTPGQMKLGATTVNIKISVFNQSNINDVVYVAVVNDVPPPVDTQITNLNPTTNLPWPTNMQGRGAQLASVVWSTNQGGNWTRMDTPRYLGGVQPIDDPVLPPIGSINNGVVTTSGRHRLQTGDQIIINGADNNITDTVSPVFFLGNNNALNNPPTAFQTPELWYVRVTGERTFEIGIVPPLNPDGTPNPAFTPFNTGIATPTSNPPGDPGTYQILEGLNVGERGEFLDIVADPNNSNLVYIAGKSPYGPFTNEIGQTTYTSSVWRGDRTAAASTGNFYVPNQWVPITNNPNAAALDPGSQPPGNGAVHNGSGGDPAWINSNTTANGSAPAGDPREMFFDATGKLVLATGGGLYRQSAPTGIAGSWTSINGNLSVTEAWSVAYDTQLGRVFIGTQDTAAVDQTVSGGATYSTALSAGQLNSTFDQSNVYTVMVDNSNLSRRGTDPAQISVRYYVGGNFGTVVRKVFAADQAVTTGANAFGNLLRSATLTFGGPATPGGTFSGLVGIDRSGTVASPNADNSGGQGWQAENQPITTILNLNDPRRALYGTSELYEDSDPIGDSGNVVNRVTPVGKSATSRFTAVAYGGRRAGLLFNQIAFAGTTEGELFRRGEFGVTFTNLNVPGGTASVDDIAVDADDWRHVFVVKGGRIYETADASVNNPVWTDVSTNLVGPTLADGTAGPNFQTTKIYTIALYDPNPGSTSGGVVLVAGGRGGVFRRNIDPTCNRTNWTEYGSGMPNTVVTDIQFYGNRLVAGTFGRGIYSIADVSGTLTAAVTLQVTGDGGANAMSVTADPVTPNAVVVNDGAGNSLSILITQFDRLQFNGLGGADSVVVGSNGQAASSSLDFAQFPIEVNAGGDAGDVLVLQATGAAGGRKVTLTGTTVGAQAGDNLFGACGYVQYSGLNQGGLFVRTGGGNDIISLAAETMPRNLDLNGGGGNDAYTFSTNTAGAVNISDAAGTDSVFVTGTVAVENFTATPNGVLVNGLTAVYGPTVKSVTLNGDIGLDTLTAVGSAGAENLLVQQTGTGSFVLSGLPATVTAAAVEAVTVNGNGGADNLNYEDRTGGTYGTVAAPAGGAVYKPTGPTSGTFNVAGGGVTNLTFVNIAGAFGVNGDPTTAGGRDVLTVLGFTSTGQATPFDEATSSNGSDTITASDAQVAITNAAVGAVRPINIAFGSNGKSSYSTVFVRTGNEVEAGVGDTVTASPTLRTNLVIDGGIPTVKPGDKLTVNVNGGRTITQTVDPALGPPQTRVTQTVNKASVGYLNIEDPTTVDVGNPNPVPVPTTGQIFAVGTQAGVSGLVLVYDIRTGAQKFGPLAPFPGFTGGLRVATGEFNGDGVIDFAVAAGPGGGPAAVVYDGATGGEISRFFPFEAGFRGGVTIAMNDVNGDGFADLIFGAGPGGGPRVKVVSGQDQTTLQDFFAYDPGFRGGVNVGSGDVNGDGRADIITGAQPGGGPHVQAFDGQSLKTLASFFAFDPSFRGGVFVNGGDVTGDGVADFVTGAGTGGGPQVNVFDARNFAAGPIRSFFVNDPGTGGSAPIALSSGVTVAAADQDGDGLAEVVTGRGPGARPFAQVFKVSQRSGSAVVPVLTNTLSVNTFGDAYSGGIYVG